MKSLILALALLIPQPAGQQQVPAPTSGSPASKGEDKYPGGVTVKNKPANPEHKPAGADDHQHDLTGSPQPQPSLPPRPRWIEHPLLRFMSLADTDKISCALFVVTSLYFLATVGILFAMRRSNKHAEKTSKESSETVTAVVTAASDFAGVAVRTLVGQYETMQTQTDTMQTQARALIASAEATVASADVTRRHLEAYDRPWLKISFIPTSALEFSEEDGGARLTLRYLLTNIGRSVATHVEIRALMFPALSTFGKFYEPIERQLELCRAKLQTDISGPWGKIDSPSGKALFPGDKREEYLSVTMSKSEMESATIPFKDAGADKYIAPVFVGCVVYRFATSEDDHYTGFAYDIGRYDPERDPNHPLAVQVGKALPLENIVLWEYFFGGHHAT